MAASAQENNDATQLLLYFGARLYHRRCAKTNDKADLILHDGRIVTVDQNFNIQQAIAIKMAAFSLQAPTLKSSN